MDTIVLQQLASNAALLLVLGFLYIQIFRRWQGKILIGQVLNGCVFGAVSIGVMMSPLHLLPGVVFDTRSVVISVGALFGGPLVAVITFGMASAFRIWQGGAGALMGVLVSFFSAALGVAYFYWKKSVPKAMSAPYLYGFGIVVTVVMLACAVALPGDMAWRVLSDISLPVIIVYPIATLLLSRLIFDRESQITADRLLKQSEEKYRRIVDTANEGVWEIDRWQNTTFANRKLAAILDYEPDELIGKNLENFVHPEEFNKFKHSMIMRRHGQSESFERRYLRKDGQPVWVQVNASPFLDDKGAFEGAVGMITDITERKRQEEALKISEERYREIVEGTNNLVTEVDKNGKFTFVNEASRSIFELSPDECIGRSAFDFIHPDDREETVKQFQGWLRKKTPNVTYENRQISQSGAVSDMLWTINFRFDSDGELAAIRSIARDITERRRAEEALRRSESRFRLTFESAPVGMALLDDHRRFLDVNAKICEITGYKRQELLGRPFDDFTHPNDQEGGKERWAALLAGEARFNQAEKRYVHKDGHDLWVLVSNTLIRDETGAPLYFVSHLIDITVRKQAEAELGRYREHLEDLVEERTAELQEANAQLKREINERKRVENELRQFAQTQEVLVREVNHRVKNNLTAIISMLHMEEDVADADENSEFLHVLRDLEGRIEGLLTIHSLLSASGWRPLEVTELCRQVVNGAAKGLPASKRVKVTIAPSGIKINSTQAHHLTMIINELTTNTIKYALEGRGEAAIDIDIDQHGQSLCIVFRDDGPGYPEHIFAPDHVTNSIGFEMIRGITTRSLGGKITFANNGGARAVIEFNNEL